MTSISSLLDRAAYKYPRRVRLVDALPKGPAGKIPKREVRPPEEAG